LAVAVSHRRFGAEVKMTDASNSGVQVASVDTNAPKVIESQRLLKARFTPLAPSDAADRCEFA
jgi:hypothetical protein